jgi:hypothetical protein
VIVAALVIAVVLLPTVALMTTWGLTGGDGEPENAFVAILGLLVGLGALYNVAACVLAFDGLADWQWTLTLVAPGAGLLGMALSTNVDESASRGDWIVGLGLQLSLALPALLLWLAGSTG